MSHRWINENVRVYIIKFNGTSSVVDTITDALSTVHTWLQEEPANAKLEIKIETISQEEFDSLEEFRGY